MEETLGKRIIANRKRLGMTQDRLAEQLGVTAQAVSKWENDQSCPDITMLPKLAGLFGISVDVLLGCEKQEKVHVAELVQPEAGNDGPQEDSGIHIQKGNWEFKLDSGRRGSIALALWVLLVGGLLFTSNLCAWNAGFWDIFWPSGLVVFGFWGMISKFSFIQLGSMFLGIYFLLRNLQIMPFAMGKELLLPLLLLLFGLSLLFDALRKPKKRHFSFTHNGKSPKRSSCEVHDDAFDCSLSFGEISTVIDAPTLRRGEASVSFGELTLDLSGCGEITDGCSIDASCSFGELTIKVPRCYRVEADISTSFGNFEIKGAPDAEPAAVIALDASANFGEICVQYI